MSFQNPSALSAEQQKDVLDYTYKLLTEFNHGNPPKVRSINPFHPTPTDVRIKGNVAPWWETTKEGISLLLDKGIEYGSSRFDSRFSPLNYSPIFYSSDHSSMAHEHVYD